ncbi:CheR family methyltransferase [Alteromonas sp. a30]|uniref:CheR family methyltransferase n=1 Tax=Alteromonas sp. a30 TaxID=2730917 RepID=UPI00228293D2|nr:protein-glutamate O-methyltransferase CheR [Alteromonas sp. a30]MCY7295377.1 protein-glutamate O-methyltransferase CheR [Alteromonas sp. a30]
MPVNTPFEKEKGFQFSRQHFNRLRSLAHEYSGIHVTDDKYEMYYARLAKRLRKLNLPNFTEYLQRVENDPIEFKEFINAITTNVTSFDREPYHFEYLKQQIKERNLESLSIWSAGCSSGEEPYSIIINLFNLAKEYQLPFSILGTDLDTDVLSKASNAIYPLKSIETYNKNTKRQFFLKGTGKNDGFCRIKSCYRDLVKYQQLNLIRNWRLNKTFDIIFCRNVMIYFENETKQKIIQKYADHLAPSGLLFLGHSESIGKDNTDFDNVGKTIYRKR